MSKIFKIKPYFSKKIWGGNKLENFGFELPNDSIGEAWLISAHKNGMSFLESNGSRISLKDFYDKYKSLFNLSEREFPLLTKIITSNDFLSVQVHPNDEYALKKHNSLGKPEAWYVLDCPPNSSLIYGHTAKTLEDFKNKVMNNQWDSLLVNVPINKGDFLYVEPGKVHAISPGLTVFELQRSSDITYRLYDYDRIDNNGKKRDLHLIESFETVLIPDSKPVIIKNKTKLLFESSFFSLYLLDTSVENKFKIKESIKWFQITVIEGQGLFNDVFFKKGESALVLENGGEYFLEGEFKMLISWVES